MATVAELDLSLWCHFVTLPMIPSSHQCDVLSHFQWPVSQHAMHLMSDHGPVARASQQCLGPVRGRQAALTGSPQDGR